MTPLKQWVSGIATFLLAVLILVPLMAVPVNSLEPMNPAEMSSISGNGGLGVQINLQINDGTFVIEDRDGRFGGGSEGWLFLDPINLSMTPDGVNDNTIYLDANDEFVQFSAPNPFTGIDLSIGEIGVDDSEDPPSFPFGGAIGTLTLGGNEADDDNNYLDSTASFNFHDTKLKLY